MSNDGRRGVIVDEKRQVRHGDPERKEKLGKDGAFTTKQEEHSK